MTNSELLKNIKNAGIWEEDAIEIIRIFEILTDEKKIEILENWNKIAAQIIRHREEIEQEKELLLIRTIENIEHDIEEYNKSLITKKAKQDLRNFTKEK